MKDIGVNYRNVYDSDFNTYRKHGLEGVRKRRKSGGRRAVMWTCQRQRDDKGAPSMNKSPRTFGYLKNTSSMRLLATYLSSLLGINVSRMQTWGLIHDLGIVSKQPKLKLQKEKDDDYEQKKGKIDGYGRHPLPF